jgi:hypothetical protein
METEMHEDVTGILAKERIALNAGTALLVAGLLLVVAVLPAEYGVDPLGVGAKLGLLAMSDAKKGIDAFQASRASAVGGPPTVAPQERHYQSETVEFTLSPRESIEYKYRLNKGDALLYSWTTTGSVNYELHGEPDGAPRGYAESFEKNQGQSASGTLTAPFSGIHGWYWENPSARNVTVTLSAAGFYNMSHEFHKGAAPKTKMFP